jgi:hypothetical protein
MSGANVSPLGRNDQVMTDFVLSLVFDSMLDAAPDVRSADMESRHLIYEGEGVILDLLLKRADDGNSLEIGGQVLPNHAKLDNVAHLPVVIEHGRNRSCTRTNALGEFMFRAAPNGAFDLAITLNDRRFYVRGLSNEEPRMWRIETSVATVGA